MTRSENNKYLNQVNNDLDYDLEDIRFELDQVRSVVKYVTDAVCESFPENEECNDAANALWLIRDALNRTLKRFEVLLGFTDPEDHQ